MSEPSVYLHHIETLLPAFAYEQKDIAQVMKTNLAQDRRDEKILSRIYAHSGIETRHSVIGDFTTGSDSNPFFATNTLKNPSTKVRNDLYTTAAKEMFVCAARKAIANCEGVTKADISHVITVSCTGFFAPGPDYFVVKELGLEATVERYHVGFMGCYAAFPALKMAQAFAKADPDAVVLVICLELCTLHLQAKTDTDSIVAASVFADGAAAAIVSAKEPKTKKGAFKLEQFSSSLIPSGEAEMAWHIGDTGFEMVLSSYVPSLLEANVASVVEPFLASVALNHSAIKHADIKHWAIHPGGRAILDKVELSLALEPSDLIASREVLRRFGNMSSATFLFVLKEALNFTLPKDLVYGMAFGPGISVESGLFSRV